PYHSALKKGGSFGILEKTRRKWGRGGFFYDRRKSGKILFLGQCLLPSKQLERPGPHQILPVRPGGACGAVRAPGKTEKSRLGCAAGFPHYLCAPDAPLLPGGEGGTGGRRRGRG